MSQYVKSIIIESNRRSAQDEFGEARATEGLYEGSDIAQFGSNHRWMTHIPDGLRLNVGDTINLESSMINAVGGGDNVIEITGLTGRLSEQGGAIKDNKAALDMAFYVANTQQFNFNLPKQRHQTCYDLTKTRYGSYANTYGAFGPIAAPPGSSLNNQDFYTWEKSYPFQTPEGCVVNLQVDNSTSLGYVYNTINIPPNNSEYNEYLPSLSSGSRRTFLPNEKRFYIGSKNFTGCHYVSEQATIPGSTDTYWYSLENSWDFLRNPIDFELEQGFITPAALGAKLTEYLHQREGNADDFQEEKEEAVIFDMGRNNADEFKATQNLGITDKANLVIPSAVGKPMYNKYNLTTRGLTPFKNELLDNLLEFTPQYLQNANTGNWNAKPCIYSGVSAVDFRPLGEGYLRNQADFTYYSYMATARPWYYKAVSKLLIEIEKYPMNATDDGSREHTVYTGYLDITIGGVLRNTTCTQQYYPSPTNDNPVPDPAGLYKSGVLGNAIVLLDALPMRVATNGVRISQNISALGIIGSARNVTKATLQVWDCKPGDFIVTNLIVNNKVEGGPYLKFESINGRTIWKEEVLVILGT